jgi:hypothetical protein
VSWAATDFRGSGSFLIATHLINFCREPTMGPEPGWRGTGLNPVLKQLGIVPSLPGSTLACYNNLIKLMASEYFQSMFYERSPMLTSSYGSPLLIHKSIR